VIEAVVTPVLHNKLPDAVVDKVELPQLFTTVTAGAVGATFGAAVAEPGALTHPLTVLFTVKVPAVVTVIESVVAPLLHNIVPPAGIDKTELPQLFTTVTTGVCGSAFGAAIPEPFRLVHPLTVLVTVYVPGVVTVTEAVVAPVLHNMVPVAVVNNVEEPQLFTTVTVGAVGMVFGAALAEPY
jgi:hypothetical protein